jgi:hypothetical protein
MSTERSEITSGDLQNAVDLLCANDPNSMVATRIGDFLRAHGDIGQFEIVGPWPASGKKTKYCPHCGEQIEA